MAVVLRREDTESTFVHPDLRNAPRVLVKNSPVHPPLTQPGTKITARSDKYYTCEEPNREENFKGTYKRRSVQLNQCGFHSTNSRPYQDLGQVELHDDQLILNGLGQSTGQDQIFDHFGKRLPSFHTLPPLSLTSPYKVKLRAKTPSQFPSDLANLSQVLEEGEDTLESIRRGKGLFELLKKQEATKNDEETEQARLQEEEEQNEWQEAEVSSHVSLTQEQEELVTKHTVSLQLEDHSPKPHQHVPEHSEASQSNSADCSWGYVYNQDRPADLQVEKRGEVPENVSEWNESPDNTEEMERWYRMLCVLVWVLEAMRMESPYHMTPFHKCWDREHPVPDESRGKRAYDMNRTQLNQWEKLKRQQSAPGKFRARVRATIFTNRTSLARINTQTKMAALLTPKSETEDTVGSEGASAKPELANGSARSEKMSRQEEEKMMLKQKKLTPLQMENLLTILEEELNYTKKKSRSRINEIIKQADTARLRSKSHKKRPQLPPLPRLDVDAVTKEFEESEERRKMIAHEQLTAMERDRAKALHQRFSSLKVSGNLWQDLSVMREGVQIETTSMARRKLLMNYEWFPELKAVLPECVLGVPKCSKLLSILEEIAAFMCEVGPKRMSRRRLIQVLAMRKPWELRIPDVSRAVEFLTERVVYIVAADYSKWLEQHTRMFQNTSK